MNILDNVYIILHLPKRSGNVGSSARIMKNFGLKNLRIVSKRNPAATVQAKKMAVHGYDILRKAKTYKSLFDALKNLHIVIGTTGKFHKDAPDNVGLPDMRKILSLSEKNKIGFLFGPEDRGLSGEELSLCNYSLTIPTSPEYLSLNLSHAVCIVGYELFGQVAGSRIEPVAKQMATRASMERMYETMRELYFKVGFLDKVNPQRMMKMIRNIYGRSEIDDREGRILLGVLKQINWYINKFGTGD
jgi:tRNA/rRNA methyltransferase